MSTNLLERARSGEASDSQGGLRGDAGLVFLCGAAVGALAMNLGVHNRLHQPAFDTAAGKALYFERMQKELELTPRSPSRCSPCSTISGSTTAPC